MTVPLFSARADLSEIARFPGALDPAVFIRDFASSCSQDQAAALVSRLPANYQLYLPQKYQREQGAFHGDYAPVVASHLRDHGGDDEACDLIAREIGEALSLFAELSGETAPLASLRVVTEDYLRREFPSVSEKYHRDSTALTITKCFFGDSIVYTDEANIRRDFFAGASIAPDDALAVFDTGIEHEVPDDTWVLLKGEMWQGIDSRSQELFDYVLGKGASFKDVFKGAGFIHKGGYFRRAPRRLVFTASSWNTHAF
ncbi:hypothetical protein [Roseateles sp.]|uniref:hypothetical protein n=1 Tax=Roseateles sp. TaxID=1971397 RepID=UPI003D12DC56